MRGLGNQGRRGRNWAGSGCFWSWAQLGAPEGPTSPRGCSAHLHAGSPTGNRNATLSQHDLTWRPQDGVGVGSYAWLLTQPPAEVQTA